MVRLSRPKQVVKPAVVRKRADSKFTKKTGIVHVQPHAVFIDAKTGRVLVDGVTGTKYVGQFPMLKIHPAPGKPKHLSKRQITEIVQAMKVS